MSLMGKSFAEFNRMVNSGNPLFLEHRSVCCVSTLVLLPLLWWLAAQHQLLIEMLWLGHLFHMLNQMT